MSCRLITTPISLGNVSNQLGTSNQSATVWRCTTSISSSFSGPGGANSRRVPCHGSAENETYNRRMTRSTKTLPVRAGVEFLHSTELGIPCCANALERSAAYSYLPPVPCVVRCNTLMKQAMNIPTTADAEQMPQTFSNWLKILYQSGVQPWNKVIRVHFKIRLRAVGRGLDRLADETIITVSKRAGHDPIMEPSDVRPVNLQNPAAGGRKKYVRQA